METELSLPHQREILSITELAFKAYTTHDPNWLGIALTDTYEHGRWLLQRLHSGVEWDTPVRAKLHREGFEVIGGGKVLIKSFSHPEGLMGLRPNTIFLFGKMGELWYHINSFHDCEIKGIA